MAWIESHEELANHPKAKRFRRRMDISEHEAVGLLHYFWWWALNFAQDGDITNFHPDDIADGCRYNGDSEQFINSLIESGFVDREQNKLLIHDWFEYGGRLIQWRRNKADRQKEYRERKRSVSSTAVPTTLPQQSQALPERSDYVPEGTVTGTGRDTVTGTVTVTEGQGQEDIAPPPDDLESIKTNLHNLINQAKIEKYNLFDLDEIYSYIGVADIEVIEAAIKKGTGKKSINYAINTLKGFIEEGKTKKEHLFSKPAAGQAPSNVTTINRGWSKKPEIPIVTDKPVELISAEELEELRQLGRKIDGTG